MHPNSIPPTFDQGITKHAISRSVKNDRIIPSRPNESDVELAQAVLKNPQFFPTQSNSYQNRLASSLFGSTTSSLAKRSILFSRKRSDEARTMKNSLISGLIPHKQELSSVVTRATPQIQIDCPHIRHEFFNQSIAVDDELVLLALMDTVYTWNRKTHEIEELQVAPEITAVQRLKSGTIVVCAESKVYFALDMDSAVQELSIQLQGQATCIQETGNFVLAADKGGMIHVMKQNVNGLQFLTSEQIHAGAIHSIAISRSVSGKITVATCGADTKVHLFTLSEENGSLSCMATKTPHSASVSGVSFHPKNPNLLATIGDRGDGKVLVWNWETGRKVCVLDTSENLKNVAWAPDGAYLLVTSETDLYAYRYHRGELTLCRMHQLEDKCEMLSLIVAENGEILTAQSNEKFCIWEPMPRVVQQTRLSTPSSRFAISALR